MMITRSDMRLTRTQSMSSTTASTRRGAIKPLPERHAAAIAYMRRSVSVQAQTQIRSHTQAHPPAHPKYLPPLVVPSPRPVAQHSHFSSSSSSASSSTSSSVPASCVTSSTSPTSPVPRTAASESRQESPGPSIASDQHCLDLEYQDEIVAHMLKLEAATHPTLGLMDTQPEVTWSMRPYLIDFMMEMHSTFGFRPETLYAAVGILDRYLSKRVVLKRHYQLAGAAAMWIAAKYEDGEDAVPPASELAAVCCQSLDESAFHQMEAHILATLRYTLGRPSHEAWLRMYFADDATLLHDKNPAGVPAVARLVLHVGLYQRELVPLPPSSVTAGALWLADLLLSPSGPVASELNRMYDELDAQACEAVVALSNALRNDDVSSVVSLLFPAAHQAVRGAFRRIQRRSSLALLSPSAESCMATPPPRGCGLPGFHTSMSPTMPLWPTPQTVATAVTDEDDSGPYTPVSALSPLVDCMHDGNMGADMSMSMNGALDLPPIKPVGSQPPAYPAVFARPTGSGSELESN